MKKQLLLVSAMISSGLCLAQEVGRVISSTPILQQVGTPRQVCTVEQVAVQQPKSGAGALMGAIAGGAAGNALGHGAGQAAATLFGGIAGAVIGNNVEGAAGTQLQNVQRCQIQTFYENATVAYNVVYEFAGRQYTVQMPNDPGSSIRLQVSPVAASAQMPALSYAQAPAIMSTDSGTQTVYVQQPANVVVVPASYPGYYAAPYYQSAYQPYYQPYFPLIGLALGYSFWGGGHRDAGHHRGHH